MESDYNITLHKPIKTKSEVTFMVTVSKWYRLRLLLAVQLFKIAAWLMNSDIEFNFEEE